MYNFITLIRCCLQYGEIYFFVLILNVVYIRKAIELTSLMCLMHC